MKPNKLVLPALVEGTLKVLDSGSMCGMLKKGHTLIYHLFIVSMMFNANEGPPNVAVQEVLDHYAKVIVGHNSLPPMISLDHAILVKPRTMTISLNPYRYN